MNAGEAVAPPSLLSRVEQLIKLVASLAAVAAATGLPAVYVQYSNLGIPTSFITSEQILRAGVVPGSLLLFVGAYVLLLIHQYAEGKGFVAVMVPGIVFVPIPAVCLIVAFAGFGAALVWLWWVILYPLFWLLGAEHLPRFWIANGVVLLSFGASLVGQFVGPFFVEFVNRNHEKWWVRVFLNFHYFPPLERARDEGNIRPANKSEPEGPPMEKREKEEKYSLSVVFAWITAGFSVYLLAGLFAIRWYLRQLDISAGPLAETSRIVMFWIVGTLGLAAFFLFIVWSVEYMSSGNQGKRLLVISLNILLVAAIFVSAIWWYSNTLYPIIPAALGGGKPETIVVWIDAKNLPIEARTLGGADCAAAGPIVRCRLQLIYRNDKDVTLATPGDGARAAMLVPRDTIKAISW